jgi:hypothetical protein
MKLALVQDKCERCTGVIEDDGFCSWHGQIFEQWLCDDCVHELRARGNNLGIVRPTRTLAQIEVSLRTLELAIKNMAMVDVVTGQDASMANRDIIAYLDFRESKQVYRLLAEILRSKLDAAKDVAAADARALLERLQR